MINKHCAFGFTALSLVIVGCSTTPLIGGGPATCTGTQLSTPDLSGSVSFETEGACITQGSAYNRYENGASDDKTVERAALINWMERNLTPSDSLFIDRFSRATLMRCSNDPSVTETKTSFDVMIGEEGDKRGIYLLMEMAQDECPATKVE